MKHKANRTGFLFTTVFLISLIFFLFLTGMYVRNKSNMETAQMEQLVMINGNKINNVISKLLYKTQVLAALAVQKDGTAQNFSQVAATVLDDPAIRNVLLAPDGVVSEVYPLEGNEAVIGLDFFAPGQGNKEAIEARNSGQLVLGGPFDLVQGGQALVGRLPVYTKDAKGQKIFWGIVSVTLNYPQALAEVGLDQLQQQGYAYEIWRVSPDTNEKQNIANSNYKYDPNARFVEKDITILNAVWSFRISPVTMWYMYPETWILGISGFIVSCLIALFSINIQNLKQVKNELEILTTIDPLTGALNRRGILSALDEMLQVPGQRFTLCYMDLNHFKNINDHYGHNAGDQILQKFSETFMRYAKKNHLFARIGGDEFIHIFIGEEAQAQKESFFDQIQNELKHSGVKWGEEEIPLEFSCGSADYPEQGKTVDELLSVADSDMYNNKSRNKRG